jgi:hypothetical protein
MKTSFIGAAMVAILAFVSAPAMADCGKDLSGVKAELASVKDPAKTKAAQDHIVAAEKSLKEKNEKACAEQIGKAKTAMK